MIEACQQELQSLLSSRTVVLFNNMVELNWHEAVSIYLYLCRVCGIPNFSLS